MRWAIWLFITEPSGNRIRLIYPQRIHHDVRLHRNVLGFSGDT